MSEWQPIQSAPKDGSRIILACQCVEIGKWDKDQYAKKSNPYWKILSLFGTPSQRGNIPTHWMPLPNLPKSMIANQALNKARGNL